MTTTSNALLLTGLGAGAAYLWINRSNKPATNKPTRPPSPFEPGSQCTRFADREAVEAWVNAQIIPRWEPRLEAFAASDDREATLEAVIHLVNEVYVPAVPDCAKTVQTEAAKLLWKWLWCDVVIQLVMRGKLNHDVDDILRQCANPQFDPRSPITGKLPSPTEVEPPPIPRPRPLPPRRDAAVIEEPIERELPNLRVASTRQELSALGVMRMMEGTAAGAPIRGPVASVVLFAASPLWPRLAQARADLARHAAQNPALSLVEVSFTDTQRHFGKPRDLGGLMWVLAGVGPDGRVFPSPIAKRDHRVEPPSEDEWRSLLAHAGGFVGARTVRKVVRPRRPGDLIRSMVASRRSTVPATARFSGRASQPRERPRVPG